MPTPKRSFLATTAALLLGCLLLPATTARGAEDPQPGEPGAPEKQVAGSTAAGEQGVLEPLSTTPPASGSGPVRPAPQSRPITAQAGESTSPPRNLKKVGDHWTPYDPPDPESFPPGATLHIIVRGDTLWGMADLAFGDPYLWPQIWNENRYILDSHWIYPGDPLLIPPRPVVVTGVLDPTVPTQVVPQGQQGAPPAGMPPAAEDELPAAGPLPETLVAEAPAPMDTPASAAAGTERSAVAPASGSTMFSDADLRCSGYITHSGRQKEPFFIGGQQEPAVVGLTEGDIVYLNRGQENGGVTQGQEFDVIMREGQILHPVSNKSLGYYYKRLGVVKVLASFRDTSVALISLACDEIRSGFELAPHTEAAVPHKTPPRFGQLTVGESGRPSGYVVHTRDNVVHVAAGDIVHVDLGTNDGIAPGDLLTAYVPFRRPPNQSRKGVNFDYRWGSERVESTDMHRDDRSDYPPRILAQLVVLATEDHTATAKIIQSVSEVVVGARVEAQ